MLPTKSVNNNLYPTNNFDYMDDDELDVERVVPEADAVDASCKPIN